MDRKNWLFMGSDQGGHHAASIYRPTEAAKLNGVDAKARMTDTISRIAYHPACQITEQLP